MAKGKHHKSTLKRMEEVRKLASELYEEGNQSKCYAAIWRTRIRPLYGVCYNTFLAYMKEEPEEDVQVMDDSQLKLFDDENKNE